MTARTALSIIAFFLLINSAIAQDLGLGNLIVDRPGVDIIGFELELTGQPGFPSYDAVATVEYKSGGLSSWSYGPDLMRLRPDLGTELARSEGFAGAVWNLTPGISYDIRITVSDPALGTQVVTTSVTTRPLARETSGQQATVVIDAANAPTESDIQGILDNASPGDIIEIRGTHEVDNLELKANGTKFNPIYLRGDGSATLQDSAGGRVITAIGNHWVVENLTLIANPDATNWVVRVDGREVGSASNRQPLTGFTLRRCNVSGRRGLRAWEGSDSEVYDVTVYDNTFSGRYTWNDIVTLVNGGTAKGATGVSSTWNDTGLKMTGQGHSIFNNTLSGFGDGIKTDRQTAISNTTISYSRNKILWGGDDGIELDDAYRNVVMSENLIMNTGTGASKQPNFVTGGPNYIVRNVLVNHYLRPFKLNDGPHGLRLIHNTVVNTSKETGPRFWVQHNNGRVEQLDVVNNIFVRVNHQLGDTLIKFDANLEQERWDGNTYWPDGEFEFNSFGSSSSFAGARGNSKFPDGYGGAQFEDSGSLLSEQPFVGGISSIGDDWTTQVMSFDPSLKPNSGAKTGAISMRGYLGVSRGAVEFGQSSPEYGSRASVPGLTRPKSPENLSIQ